MKVENLKAALQARPFRPFEIRVDGESIPVEHPEQLMLVEKETTVIVDLEDRIHIMDVAEISKLALLRRQRGAARKAA